MGKCRFGDLCKYSHLAKPPCGAVDAGAWTGIASLARTLELQVGLARDLLGLAAEEALGNPGHEGSAGLGPS